MKSCYVESDLDGAKTMKNWIYMFLFPFNSFFVFRSEWICCPFKNTESDITWWDSHIIGFMLHVKSDLNFLIRFYLDSIIWIGSDLQRSGAAWMGQEVSSGFALAAHAARLRHTLAARARSQLLQKIYEFIPDNCKKYMNSYIIWIHICMNSYI